MRYILFFLTCILGLIFNKNLAAQNAIFNELDNRFQSNNELLLLERSINDDKKLLQNVSKKPFSSNIIRHSKANILDNVNKKCFLIYKLYLRENKLISQKFFQKKVKSYYGQCLTLNQIQQIKYNLNNYLYSEGFTTSQITIPKQNITSEEVYFDIFIGKVGKVAVQNKSNPEDTKNFIVAGGIANNILNIKNIDIINSQLNSLSSKNYKVKIIPSQIENSSEWTSLSYLIIVNFSAHSLYI